jgi:hypothetical protein
MFPWNDFIKERQYDRGSDPIGGRTKKRRTAAEEYHA